MRVCTVSVCWLAVAAAAQADRMEIPLLLPSQAETGVYFAGKRPVPLEEVAGELVVAYGAGARAGARATGDEFAKFGLASAGVELAPGLAIHSVLAGAGGSESIRAALTRGGRARYAYPLLRARGRNQRLAPTDEVIVNVAARLDPAAVDALARRYGARLARAVPSTGTQFVLRIERPNEQHPVATANALRLHPDVLWAEPHFYEEIRAGLAPSDPIYPAQWHLNNTGQSGGVVGADLAAPGAWEITAGSSEIVVAVLDNGVQLDHPDLAGAIYRNPREQADFADSDGNGYIDDLHGWDFRDNDNDPSPTGGGDRHGTAVAGIIAASADGAGVVGVAPGVKILPLRIARGDTDFASTLKIAEALRYAARHADVINNSWAGGGVSETLTSALDDVLRLGRGGKGCPNLFAAGNGASGWTRVSLPIDAGPRVYRWEYSKDFSVSLKFDSVWLDDVTFPDGARFDFNDLTPPALPAGWTSSGAKAWASVDDPAFARGGAGRSLRAGTITHSQQTRLETTRDGPAGQLVFYVWVSCEERYDLFRFYVDGKLRFELSGGGAETTVAAPASLPQTIAVGASTNFDERAPYSQFGPELDIVAPSSGGSLGVWTTDLTGSAGYSPGNECLFGGTSAACPAAAGCVALLLSLRPELRAEQVRALLHASADKIGPDPYDAAGRNDQFGHGRVNAQRLLQAQLELTPPPPDGDHDGLPDDVEGEPPDETQPNRLLADSDGDGLLDGEEDANRNGRTDPGETDPRRRDSDSDGWDDKIEIAFLASDPLNPASPPGLGDGDGDGLPTPLDPNDARADSDGDRYADAYEAGKLDLPAVADAGRFFPLGDFNIDGRVSNKDSLMIQAFFLGKTLPEAVVYDHSDANRDGYITNGDALIVQAFFLATELLLPR